MQKYRLRFTWLSLTLTRGHQDTHPESEDHSGTGTWHSKWVTKSQTNKQKNTLSYWSHLTSTHKRKGSIQSETVSGSFNPRPIKETSRFGTILVLRDHKKRKRKKEKDTTTRDHKKVLPGKGGKRWPSYSLKKRLWVTLRDDLEDLFFFECFRIGRDEGYYPWRPQNLSFSTSKIWGSSYSSC